MILDLFYTKGQMCENVHLSMKSLVCDEGIYSIDSE